MKIAGCHIPGVHAVLACVFFGYPSPLASTPVYSDQLQQDHGGVIPPQTVPLPQKTDVSAASLLPKGGEERRRERRRGEKNNVYCQKLARKTLLQIREIQHIYEDQIVGLSMLLHTTTHLPQVHTTLRLWTKSKERQRIRLVAESLQFYQPYLQSRQLEKLALRVDPRLPGKLHTVSVNIRDILHLLNLQFQLRESRPTVHISNDVLSPVDDWQSHSQVVLLLKGLGRALERAVRELVIVGLRRKQRHFLKRKHWRTE